VPPLYRSYMGYIISYFIRITQTWLDPTYTHWMNQEVSPNANATYTSP